MLMSTWRPKATRDLCFLLATGLALALGAGTSRADASYLIEFNGRMASPTGHLFMIIYRIKDNGDKQKLDHFGFFAAGGQIEYVLSVVGTKGKVGLIPTDLKVKPLARFAVALSEAQYWRVTRFVNHVRSHYHVFSLFTSNCNWFAGRVALAAGLKTSAEYIQFPPDYVRTLRDLNRQRARNSR
jgi:hypothetical protein